MEGGHSRPHREILFQKQWGAPDRAEGQHSVSVLSWVTQLSSHYKRPS